MEKYSCNHAKDVLINDEGFEGILDAQTHLDNRYINDVSYSFNHNQSV